MAPATAHFESDADRRRIWRNAMRIRTTEASQQEYPEAKITATTLQDRHASCHSKNIPEPRPDMMSSFPNSVIAMPRRMRTETQAGFHAMPDHERKLCEQARPANRWPSSLSSDAYRNQVLRHRACWQKCRPSAFAPSPCDPPAPPASDT